MLQTMAHKIYPCSVRKVIYYNEKVMSTINERCVITIPNVTKNAIERK